MDGARFSLEGAYHLNLSDIRYLKAFESVERAGHDILDVYKKFAINDSDSVSSVVLSSRGQYVGTATPSLVTKPRADPKRWTSFWHPLYGVCFAFQLDKPLAEVVGDAGLEFVKVNLNFEKAFPALEEDQMTTVQSDVVTIFSTCCLKSGLQCNWTLHKLRQ